MTSVWRPKLYVSKTRAWLQRAYTLIPFAMDNYEAIQVRFSSPMPASPHASPFKDPAQITRSVLPVHTRLAPPTHRTRSPRLHLCTHILLLHVRAIHIHSFSRNLWTFIHSLPKDSIPFREGAVASLASILGGFGVVALFCSVGVNV